MSHIPDTANSSSSGIDEAIKVAGGQVRLSESLGVSQQLVSSWKRRGYVSTCRVVEVEQISGVSRDRLINPRLRGLLETNAI